MTNPKLRHGIPGRHYGSAKSPGTSFDAIVTQPAQQRSPLLLARLIDHDSVALTPKAERWLALAFVLAGSLLSLLRVPIKTWGTFYAEDGRTFTGQWAASRGLDPLFREYAGYQHLLPRLVSLVVQVLPIDLWAYATTATACAAVAMCGCISFLATRDLGLNRSLRVAVGILPILSPLAGFEALGSIANLHWYMTYMLIWVFMAVPRRWLPQLAYGSLSAVAALTEPQTVILLPVLILQLVRTRGACWPIGIGWFVGFSGQLLTYLAHPLVRVSDFHDFGSAALGFTINVSGGTVFDTGRELGFVIVHTHWMVVVGWAVVLLGAGILATFLVRGDLRIVAIVAVIVAVASWSASYFLNDHSHFEYQMMSPQQLANVPLIRWGTTAAMALPVGLLVLFHAFRGTDLGRRWVPLVGASLLVLVMLVGGFQSSDNRRGGPGWKWGVAQAQVTCSDRSVNSARIARFPSGWAVTIPCRLLS